MTTWPIYKLGEIAHITTGFPFKGDLYSSVGTRVLRGENIGDKVLRWDSHRDKRWNQSFERADDYALRADDIVLAMDGNVGKNKARIKTDDLPLLLAQRVACVRNNQLSNQVFLYYVLNSREFADYLNSVKTGTTIQHISMKQIADFEVSLPPLSEQKRIAGILGALDDKIELNHRINANLEEQAKALYKSWFVDKPNLKWHRAKLSEIATFVSGYSYKGNELVNSSDIAMATIKNFHRNGGFKTDGFKDIIPSIKLRNEQRAHLFDILVAHTDLTQNADVIGNAELLLTLGRYKEIIISMDLVKVLPKENFPYNFLLAALLKNPLFKTHCIQYTNGTTVLHLSKKALPEYDIILPHKEDAAMMDNMLKPYYQKMSEILRENEKLAALRDTLLPKLMNGKIKI